MDLDKLHVGLLHRCCRRETPDEIQDFQRNPFTPQTTLEGFLTKTLLVWIELMVDAEACLVIPVSLDDLLHLLHIPRLVLHKLDISIQARARGLAARVFRRDCSN